MDYFDLINLLEKEGVKDEKAINEICSKFGIVAHVIYSGSTHNECMSCEFYTAVFTIDEKLILHNGIPINFNYRIFN